VFNTGMTGYQEIVSDPSYAGQFVTLTTAEVGNYGCTQEDMESRSLFLNGLIVQELNPASNWRSREELSAMMARFGKPGLAGVDTRALTLHLRTAGSQKAYLHVSEEALSEEEAVRRAQAWEGLEGQDYASLVTTPVPYDWNESGRFHVVVYDFGVKYNILRMLAARGMRVTVVPATTLPEDVLAAKPDGVFLSNGPADPSAVTYAIENIRMLLGRGVPMMGICLGHQLLGLACGAKCGRLKFGHHGCNHPVKNILTGEVAISSQNHNFALTDLPAELELTHINLNDNTIEGIRHKSLPAFSVQYHPEAAPGPHDAAGLFDAFRKLMEDSRS
jgi:carbamoyl-phosphate synthase small subunit